MFKNLKEVAQRALEIAMKEGCRDVRVGSDMLIQSSFSVRNDNLDRLHQSTGSSLYLQLYVDGRYGYYSTNRTEERELNAFIKNAVEATRLISFDPDRVLPSKDLYFKGKEFDLKQFDNSYDSVSPEVKKEIAFACAAEMFGKDKRVVSVNCEYGDSLEYYYMADTGGFEGEMKQTLFTISSECSVKDRGDARPEAWWYESSLMFDSLTREGTGRTAMERALSRLNPKKMKSGKYNMVIENTVASRVISPIISALNGSAIQQKNSFLEGKLGSRLFPESLYFTDRPHIIGAEGSRFYDGEGIATKNINIIDAGVVNTYFINTYNSRKLGMPVTIEGPSVLSCSLGENFPSGSPVNGVNEILNIMERGILVTGFNGGNTNSSSGDFSFGVQGFYFENGKVLHPIKEMNVTGNIISLWNSVAEIGDDPRNTSRWLIPTLAFESVNFNGN